MNEKAYRPFSRLRIVGLCLVALYLVAMSGLAQASNRNLWVTDTIHDSLTVSWRDVPGVVVYNILYRKLPNGFEDWAGATSGNSFTIKGLDPYTYYVIKVEFDGGAFGTTARTSEEERVIVPEWRPIPVTCPHLPPRVVVSGYVENTQCQMVGEVVVANTDLFQRGFIDAVDVWSYVNGGVEVCFRDAGTLVFLDATYLQRMLMDLESYKRDGMTCGAIDRIGTVLLLRSAAPAEAPTADETAATLPTIDAIPQSDCQIKLMETLFLRAELAGEIIGLVWLNSEVPVFEINGYWYKIEFEGKSGYISRHYRRVLCGGCV